MKKLVLLLAFISALFSFRLSADETQADLMQQAANLPLEKALFVARDILDTPIAGHEEEVEGYNTVLFAWITSTDKFSLELRASITPLISTGDGFPYLLGAYLAGETFSIIGSGLSESDLSTFKAAIKLVIDYYKANREMLGDVAELTRLESMSPDELDKALTDLYNAD